MKKTQKKVFGLLGLSLVAGMTMVAATIPSPGASAVSTSSVTDTLVVRVVGNEPDVTLGTTHNGVTYGKVVVDPIYWVTVTYQDLNKLDMSLIHTDKNGTEHKYTFSSLEPDYVAGDLAKQLALNNYGYGDYVFNVQGYGYSYDGGNEGSTVPGYAEDSIKFTYLPVIAKEDEDGTYRVATDTNPNSRVGYVYITVDGEVIRGEDGQPKKFYNGDIVPVDRLVAKEGDAPYIIGLTAYDDANDPLYKEYTYRYVSDLVPDTGAPDTGALFQNLNISKEDYLITGLMVFFVISIVAIGVISRNRKTTKSLKRRR